MKQRFTKLLAAVALLVGLAIPMGMWGQTATLVSGSGSSGYSIPDGWEVSGNVEGGSYLKFNEGTITSPTFEPHNGLSFTYSVATFDSGTNHPLTIRILNASTNAVIVEMTTATPTSSSYITTDSPLSLGDVTVAFKIQMYGPTAKGVRLRNYSVTGTPAGSGPTYTITAQSNNPVYGTVSLSGTTITASPATGYRVSTTNPYTVSPAGSATVSQNGNQFNVTPSDNTTVTINFEAIPTHSVTLPENDVYGTYTMDANNPVAYGTTVTLNYEPATGYENYVAIWSVNGTIISGNSFSMPDEDAVVTVSVAQGVTWDLTSASYDENPTESLIQWSSDYATMKNERNGNSNTAVTNFIPPTNSTTRFYKNNKFSLIPATDYVITSAVFTATTVGYATAFAGSNWTNATATVNGTTVTITPTNGAQTISAILGGTCGFTSATVCYTELAYYAITVDGEIENGSVSVNDNLTQAHEGTLISLTATPASGYAWQSWNVYKTGDSQTTVSVTNDQFTMPAYPVTVSATFRPLNTFTVSYFVNGNVVSAEQVTEGNNANLPDAPAGVPSGFTFAGWSTSEANTTIITSYTPENNASLYAVFSKEQPVTYSFTMVPTDFSSSGYESNKVHAVSAVAQQSGETITVSYTANDVMHNNTSGVHTIQWKKSSGVISGSISNAVITKVEVNETTDDYLTTIVTNENNVGSFSINNNGSGAGKASDVTVTFTKNSATYYTRVYTQDITGYGTDHAVKNGWYLIASPVANDFTPSADNGFITDYYDLYRFNQAAELEWENQEEHQNDFNIESGRGYLYASSTNTTLVFAGTPYDGNGEVTLHKTNNANADFAGWNLVGNPFASNAKVSKAFCKMNSTSDGINANPYQANSVIASMEGVFVLADQDEEKVTFTATTDPVTVQQSRSISLDVNRNGEMLDRAIVSFNAEGSLSKLVLSENTTKLYIRQGQNDYAIVASDNVNELPVSFKASRNGTYTLGINTENVEMNYLHLIDNMTGMDVDLLQTPSYTFDATTNDYTSRFRLVFSANGTTGNEAETFAFFSNGNWVIGNEGEATLQVIDVNGRIVSNETINGSVATSINATPGVYMLRLVNGNEVKTQKIVVR